MSTPETRLQLGRASATIRGELATRSIRTCCIASFVRVARTAFVTYALDVLALRGGEQSQAKLDPSAIRQVLNDLKVALDERWSYRHANRADFDGAIAKVQQAAGCWWTN